MAAQQITLFRNAPLALTLGGQLSPIEVAYQTYGKLNADGSNAILICHALTGDAEPYFAEQGQGWWQNFMGDGLALDTSRYFFICSNCIDELISNPIIVNVHDSNPIDTIYAT